MIYAYMLIWMASACHTDTEMHSTALPQLSIGTFAHLQSNGVVDETEDQEMVEAEGPPAKDHLNSNAPGAGALQITIYTIDRLNRALDVSY